MLEGMKKNRLLIATVSEAMRKAISKSMPAPRARSMTKVSQAPRSQPQAWKSRTRPKRPLLCRKKREMLRSMAAARDLSRSTASSPRPQRRAKPMSEENMRRWLRYPVHSSRAATAASRARPTRTGTGRASGSSQ